MKSDVGAERGILAGILKYGYDGYVETLGTLKNDTFQDTHNIAIWNCIQHIYKDSNTQKIDYATLASAAHSLNLDGYFNQTHVTKHVRALMNFDIDISSIRPLCKKIRTLALAKELSDHMRKSIMNMEEQVTGEESPSTILSYAEQPLFKLENCSEDNVIVDMGAVVGDYIKSVLENPVDQVGIPTGFPVFDAAIGGGLRDGTVNVIGARPKVGKSLMAANLVKNITSQGIPVLYLDTEMSVESQLTRMLGMLSGVDFKRIETGKFGNDRSETRRVLEAEKFLKSGLYHYCNISGFRFEEILAQARRWLYKHVGLGKNNAANDCVIIYDYLKLMSSNDINANMQEYQIIGFQITELHNFAVKYKLPIVSFVQLNRDGATQESLTVASQSDRIGWLCSNFTIMKPLNNEEIAPIKQHNINRKLVPVAARHGPPWDDEDFINLKVNFSCGQIVEHNTYKQLNHAFETESDAALDMEF